MLFNSYSFFIFFAIVFVCCLIIQQATVLQSKIRISLRNIILLIASYYFYSFMKWEFAILLFIVTLINYIAPICIEKEKKKPDAGKARLWVGIAVVGSIGILAYFKYSNFFIESVNYALSVIGIEPKLGLLQIVLPIGISFFTFQALTYTLDVYRGKIPVSRNFIDVALFVSFFPTILSGPIEKARNLMPQLSESGKINMQMLIDGGKLFVWGLFKKIVVADRLASYINTVYGDSSGHSSVTLFVTAAFYSIQIYADFSGYTDMAIGVGKTLGFNLSQNFNFPYFSSSIKSFWKKWHISLTSWFTEYLYISMGGNRVSKGRWLLNISSVFLLSGLWHGASWSFIIWGALHAIYYLIEYYLKSYREFLASRILKNSISRFIAKLLSILFVFILVTIAWIFFRIENTEQVFDILGRIFSMDSFSFYLGGSAFSTILTILLLFLFIVLDFVKYKKFRLPSSINIIGYAVLLCIIFLFGVDSEGFVYFQF